jgi:hypothetical protein
MKLQVNDQLTVADLSEQFTKQFPYLRLEFFHHFHKEGVGNAKADKIDGNKRIGEIRTQHNASATEINAQMKVADVETIFKNNFGLSVQVFRKSGKSWLETTATDSWTLEKQNATGEEYEK